MAPCLWCRVDSAWGRRGCSGRYSHNSFDDVFWMAVVFASVIQFVEALMVVHWAGFFLHLLIAMRYVRWGLLCRVRRESFYQAAAVRSSVLDRPPDR